MSTIAFLVNPDGTVKRSIVVNSSGSERLDRATSEALSKCLFTPITDSGKPVEGWFPVEYTWIFGDNSDRRRAIRDVAAAAAKGDLAARYQLSVLLRSTATTDAERDRALLVLRSAADLGYAPAQFALGSRYESGNRVKTDLEEALRWYQKAAAQGDVLAIQRMKLGTLPPLPPLPLPPQPQPN